MDKLHEHAEKFREFENKLSVVDEDVQNLLQDQIRSQITESDILESQIAKNHKFDLRASRKLNQFEKQVSASVVEKDSDESTTQLKA